MIPVQKVELKGMQIASGLVPCSSIEGDDEEDSLLLHKMSDEATEYISSFSWCDAIHESYFGGGVGGIFAVFFFHIHSSRPDVDSWIWVVIGDIPPAYLPLADCESPAEVFRSYIRGMSRWVEVARVGGDPSLRRDVPPIDLPAKPEWAEKINQKLYGLTVAVGPIFQGRNRVPVPPQ
jgi:hypothetical protein